MERKKKLEVIAGEIGVLTRDLKKLTKKNDIVGRQINEVYGKLIEINRHLELILDYLVFPSSEISNILLFPTPRNSAAQSQNDNSAKAQECKVIVVPPGKSAPQDVPDYRDLLQRDGLILLSWDSRKTEIGDRYTVYWVTSAGPPRFYASKQFKEEDIYLALPARKSYAAEDGIDFYGQEAPAYIVHVAPELMKSNPKHGELRLTHIDVLKVFGSKIDFEYKYLLKTNLNQKKAPKEKN